MINVKEYQEMSINNYANRETSASSVGGNPVLSKFYFPKYAIRDTKIFKNSYWKIEFKSQSTIEITS